MDFLQLIPACHERSFLEIRDRAVECSYCQTCVIPDIHAFIRDYENVLDASRLAQAYYDMTQDDSVPVPIVIINIDGILPKRMNHQSLAKVRKGIAMLKAINAPFTENGQQQHQILDDTFLQEYLDTLTQTEFPDHEQVLLNHLIQCMTNSMDSSRNKFDYYFNELVPHVQKCAQQLLPPDDDDDSHPLQALLNQLHRSRRIRDWYSPYSIPFDVFHVLVSAFTCDIEVVGNWVLDFVARICRGEFFWKRYPSCPLVQHLQRVLKTEVSYKRNTELYYVLREMERGNGIECLSENFPKYLELDALVREKANECWQLFPSVVFQDHKDHFAFIIAMTVVVSAMDSKTGQVPKGTYSKARRLHKIVFTLMEQVQKFDSSGMTWTIDMFRLFLASSPDTEKQMSEVANVVFGPAE